MATGTAERVEGGELEVFCSNCGCRMDCGAREANGACPVFCSEDCEIDAGAPADNRSWDTINPGYSHACGYHD